MKKFLWILKNLGLFLDGEEEEGKENDLLDFKWVFFRIFE